MSGRDFYSFVTQHRTDDTDRLVTRVKDGFLSSKYKQVDYDELRALAAEKKFAAQESVLKVKKLEQVSKQSREQSLLKQHRRVWQQEFSRLAAMRRRAQADTDAHNRLNQDSQHCHAIYQDFEDYEMGLEEKFAEFRKSTSDPIWTLRDDLLYWMHQNKVALQGDDGTIKEEHQRVLQTVTSVKRQQENILQQLQNEQISLENELKNGDLLPSVSLVSQEERQVQTGIPIEAFDLPCPYPDLKSSVLQEFIFIDEKYVEKLTDLDMKHEEAIRSRTGGWSEDDHYLFQVVQDQYTHDIPNRRMLCIDRLLRHFPHKTRAHIVAHEDWLLSYQYYHRRKHDLTNDWIRDRRELFNRARVVFNEAQAALVEAQAKAEYHEMQQQLCDALYDKVQKWREQKMEALRLEHELEEARREEELRKQKAEQERERKKRDKEKQKIGEYQNMLNEKKRKESEAKQRQLEKLQKLLAEQALYDRERVKYRDDESKKKEEEKKRKEQEKKEQEEEKERILESLREQVRPHVEGDLLRVWKDTESWQHHVKPPQEDINLQRPLFELNTFSSKQVTNDPRVRIEGKLRDAGLLNTDYARKIMKDVRGPQAPRRDMESTVFKQ